MSGRSWFLVGLIIVVLFFTACSYEQSRVSWVTDADTLVVDDRVIRISNIDAYELGSPVGDEAHRFVIDLLYDEVVTLRCDGFDKYDRELCLVEFAGRDVGQLLVQMSYARYWK